MRRTLILWALTSALLILAVLLLRAVLGKRMGAGLRYALWGVVLLRLLVPVQMFTAPVPVPVPELNVPQAMETSRPGAAPAFGQVAGVPAITGPLPDDVAVNITTIPEPAAPEVVSVDVPKLLGWLWLAGSVVTAAVFLASNISFARRLRRVRQDLKETDCELPVYIAGNLPSPCLFGVLRPAIYVTPEAAADPDLLRHVLAHEYTHFRHGDHVWNVLRGLALAVHWWNPLVWLAAALSRKDCELACDEGALKRLGEEERFTYGRTLLALIGARSRPVDLLSCATTMTGDGKTVAQRVKRIAQAPKRWLWAAVAAALLGALVTVCAFGQAEKDPPDLWPDGVVRRTYTRDNGGFPDKFTIRLDKDGAFTYYEGSLSSYIGVGTWTQEGDVICLIDSGAGKEWRFYFKVTEDALIFQAENSTRFTYVDVADGERFSLTYTGPIPAEEPDTAPTDSPSPAPSEPAAPELVYTIGSFNGIGTMQIDGLDCGGARWYTEGFLSGVVVAGRRDLMDAKILGSLTVTEPRFLGEAFAAENGELLAVYYPEEGPLFFFGFDEHGDGPEKRTTASMYAFVDLTTGLIRGKEVSGFGDRAEAFTDELLVDTARTLAGLIQDAAGYYARTAPSVPAETNSPDPSTVQPELLAEYYAAGSLPLFELAFSKQSNIAVQSGWLNQLYADGDTAFFSAAVRGLGENSSLIPDLAEQSYTDGEIAFFSILTDHMDEGELRAWLDRALADGKWNFQSMLLDKLGMDKEKDAKEEELDAAQAELEAEQAQLEERRNAAEMQAGGQGQVMDSEQLAALQKELEAAGKKTVGGLVGYDPDGPKNKGEEEWERRQAAEYQAVGVTMDGKKYYYQGQLVNIFLDIRANGSFYTLDTNPSGTVNIKILRDGANNITGVTYMTEAEAAELLSDMRDE